MGQDYVKYAVSVTPIEQLDTENNTTKDIVASEVNTSLGGDGTSNVTNYGGTASAQGFLNTAPYYVEAIDSADTTALTTETTCSFIHIKNTGYTYSSSSALGAALDASLKVMAGDSDKECIAVLEPGASICLPCNTGANVDGSAIYVRSVNHDGTANTSIGHLAVEFLGVD